MRGVGVVFLHYQKAFNILLAKRFKYLICSAHNNSQILVPVPSPDLTTHLPSLNYQLVGDGRKESDAAVLGM